MTLDAREKSQYTGQPIEGYQFSTLGEIWRQTSADKTISLPTGDYTPVPIKRGDTTFDEEDNAETVDIHVARDHEVAALFIGEQPTSPVFVTIWRTHRSDESLASVFFQGTVQYAEFDENSQAVLKCASILSRLNRSYPTLRMQPHCNHILYSANCGANPTTSRDLVTVSSIDGNDVVTNDFTAHADGWYSKGWLETLDGSVKRYIARHVGDTCTLMSPMPGVIAGQQVWAVWGCNHLESDCGPAKFNNLVNHLGWADTVSRNPFDGRVD